MKRLVCLCVLLICTGGAHAQSWIHGSFSAAHFSGPNAEWEYGVTPGFCFEPWNLHFAHAGVDIRAMLVGSGQTRIESAMAGPRLRVHPHALGLKPYGEILVGGAHVTVEPASAPARQNGPQFQLIAGVEREVSPRVDWRLAEVAWGEVLNLGAPLKTFTASTGLLLRFP